MHRLSIVIPCSVFNQDVEDTLVSVLQNRPQNTEVIVVTAGEYDDPYELADEVTFIEAAKDASLVQLVNQGFEAACAEVVHLLQPGVRVLEGWTDHVLDHFDDPALGALSPVMVQSASHPRATALGVAYWKCGVRRVLGRGSRLSSPRLQLTEVLGPTFLAGFYRRKLWQALGEFDEKVGADLADIELALAMKQLCYQARVEPLSRVVLASPRPIEPSSFRRARSAELLYRRYLPAGALMRLAHVGVILTDVLAGFPRPQMIARLTGRLIAWLESGVQRRQQQRLEQAKQFLAQATGPERLPAIRLAFSKSRAKRSGRSSSHLRRRAA